MTIEDDVMKLDRLPAGKSQIIMAAVCLEEASKQLDPIEPELSLALLNSAEALLRKHQIDQTSTTEFKALSDELREDS